MAFFIVVSVVLMLAGGWYLTIAILGRFPWFLSTAMGTLVRGTRNITRDKYGRTYRNPDGSLQYTTRYTYVYTVRGKQYRYSGSGSQRKSRLPPKLELIYVKWFPRHVYPYKFTGSQEWALGVLLLLAALWTVFVILPMLGG